MEFGNACRKSKDREEKQQRIDRVTVTKRGMSEVVDEWIEYGKDCEWRSERICRASDE